MKNKLAKSLIQKYNVKALKKLGQNFLIDEAIIHQIVKISNVEKDDVIEIGPGLGALTFPLLEKAKSVTAYEIDPKMQDILEKEITNPNFHLIKQNFLQANFYWNKKRKIVASIPYNITTNIIFKLLQNINKFKLAILILQKEFAEKLLAQPKAKNYGKLTVSLQSVADIKGIMVIKNKSFFPIPKVDSMLVKITFYSKYEKNYFQFVLRCFSQRRKTLFNNLKNFINQDKITDVFQQMKFHKNIRPQELSVVDFKKLWNYLQ